MNDPRCFAAHCPSRQLFDQIFDKWSVMVLVLLKDGPHRFNAIRRALEGVSQKALTQCLRRLERNGLVSRKVIDTSPVAVSYELTPLGASLHKPFEALYSWAVESMDDVTKARTVYDSRRRAAEDSQPA